MSFFGHVMRKGQLENIVTTAKINGKRKRGKPSIQYMDQIKKWTENDGAAWQVGLHCRRKAGGPARLRSGERGPTGIAARSTSHSLRYAALRSDWVWWLMEAR